MLSPETAAQQHLHCALFSIFKLKGLIHVYIYYKIQQNANVKEYYYYYLLLLLHAPDSILGVFPISTSYNVNKETYD